MTRRRTPLFEKTEFMLFYRSFLKKYINNPRYLTYPSNKIFKCKSIKVDIFKKNYYRYNNNISYFFETKIFVLLQLKNSILRG